MARRRKAEDVGFEEALHDEWARDFGVVEVSIGNRPLAYLWLVVLAVGLVVVGRVLELNLGRRSLYEARAQANLSQTEKHPAPRGLIYDRSGVVLAENIPVFLALLDMREFLLREELRSQTLEAIGRVLGLTVKDVLGRVKESDPERFGDAVILNTDLTQAQVIELRSLNLPTLIVEAGFTRRYPDGPVFASLLGYTGMVSSDDFLSNPGLTTQEFVGKSGLESFYDKPLRGKPGVSVRKRDARGNILEAEDQSDPEIGEALRLTIDGGLQSYFYRRLEDGLFSLGRNIGVGVAMDPRSGEVLALVNLPSFDNNVLGGAGRNEEKRAILNSPFKPLFNRAVGGFYNPGSTIKPLVGIAALYEGVVSPEREIFSPGYLDVPNPYDPEKPTRFLDWRYQGNVDLSSAIAQSSNVYFYTVGGGTGEIRGLGIGKLREWWERFGFGKESGIDLSGEAEGFLPSARWKEEKTGKLWLLGDTYNVSIGQGDILATPIQILNYISAIANGGTLYRPFLNRALGSEALGDLSSLRRQIGEVRKGMREAVTSPLGTARLLDDLGFSVAAKTGTAQVHANTEENAFFVGYAPASADPPARLAGAPAKRAGGAGASAGKPAEQPQIAILVLVENAREGSLNAVPIAKDVLNWYYWNRIRK